MHSSFFTLAVLCMSLVVNALPLQKSSPDYPVVKDVTCDISYQGISSNGIESFLNIQFGQDTSGNNRFAAPKPFEYDNGTLVNASAPGAACPQPKVPVPGLTLFSNITNVSEDCLTLRVDRPANTTADAKLPVMLWIYGGGDTIGQIYDQAYDPTGLVLGSASKNTPVIYAAMNYRVGFFGFSAFNDSNTDAVPNAGLLDQRLGMEWVQKHIASFGGDPERVTIFGESDGATGVGLQITAYGGTQPVPFHQAIMESGSATADPGVTSDVVWNNTQVLTKILCSNVASNVTASIECLRNMSLDQIFPAENETTYAFDPFAGFDTFFPVVDKSFVPAAPSQLLMQGNFSKDTSIIAGWNEDDGSVFVDHPPSAFANSSFLQSWIETTLPGLNESSISTVLSLYPANSSTFDAKKEAFPTLPIDWIRASQIERDSSYACPALFIAQAMAQYSSSTSNTAIYTYILNTTLFAPSLAAENLSFEGVTHFSDIPYVFNQATYYNTSQEQIALASQVSGSWVQFAYSGNPVSQEAMQTPTSNLTLTDWPNGYSGAAKGDFAVKVIGAAASEVFEAGQNLDMSQDFEELGRRCAFWNSPAISEQVGV